MKLQLLDQKQMSVGCWISADVEGFARLLASFSYDVSNPCSNRNTASLYTLVGSVLLASQLRLASLDLSIGRSWRPFDLA